MDVIGGLKEFFCPKVKDSEQSTNAAARAAEQQSVEETSMAAASGKRAHEADSSSSEARGSKKVKQSGSEEDDNLTPNYNAHPESTPISMPGRRPYHNDWKGQPAASQAAAKMAPARRGGGFKPMDTLANSAPQAAKTSIFRSFVGNNPRTAKPSQPNGRPQPASGRNGTVPRSSPMEHAQDPIEDDTVSEQPVTKRRKVAGGKMSTTVDLTDEDEGTPVATGREKDERRGSGGSQVSNVSKRAKNQTPWAPTERQKVDAYMKVNPGELRLSQVDAKLRFSPETQRAIPAANDNGAITIVDDDPPNVNGKTGVGTSSTKRELNPKKRQEINLTEGWEEITEKTLQKHQGLRKPQQQSGKQPPRAYTQADANKANELMSSAAVARNSKPMRNSQPTSTARRSREQSHETNDGSFGSYIQPSAAQAAAPETASLQKKFVRDDALAPKSQTATQRMQTGGQSSSLQSPNDDSLDELGGPPNIRRSTSRQVSPVKPSPAHSQTNGRPPSRQFSPSNIKPTNFKGSHAKGLQLPLHAQPQSSDVDSLQDAADDGERIPIKSIFCKAVCSDVKRLELVWDDSQNAYFVFAGNQRQRAPHTKNPIMISPGDVKDWYHTVNDTRAYIKGPASEFTTGQLVLEFQNVKGLQDCFAALQHDNFTSKPVNQSILDKMFQKQRNEQLEAHKREMSKGSMPAAAPFEKLTRATPARKPQREEQEERIVYENSSPPPPQPSRPARARDRMQTDEADTLTQALHNAEYQNSRQNHQNDKTSRFFEAGGTRRSTRQAKPVQYEERAPPPMMEKWSQIHKLDPWAQPVLYPPEGAKRVTVEFDDLHRLDEEEWLNDNLVNYELKHIESQMKPEDREKVHFFNTFFFTSVSNNGNKRALNYDAVKRWTKNVDIFNIPYLVVPISENLHWFVVVICNLHNLPRKVAGFEDEVTLKELASNAVLDPEVHIAQDGTAAPVKDNVEVQRSPEAAAGEAGSSPAAAQGHQDHDQASATDAAADAPEAETFTFDEDGKVTGTHDDLALDEDVPTSSRPSTATGKKSKKKAYAPIKYDPDQPILIALDSFGNPRSAEMKILKQWVAAEAESKRGMQVDWRSLQGMNAKGLPTQANFSDCGVYLAGYIHEFAKDPQKFITKAMLKKLEQENLFDDFDPVKKRDDMRNRLLKLHKEQEDERIARKRAKAKAAAKNALTPQAPKVAEGGKTEDAKAQSSPALRSSPAPAPPPKSDSDKLAAEGGPAAEQIQQELSSATAAGEDDLPYEEPLALGAKADRDEPSDPLPSSDREPVDDDDDDDEEMLDNQDVPEGGNFRFPDGWVGKYPSPKAPHVDIFAQDLPVAPTERPTAPQETNQADELLCDLLKYASEPSEKKGVGENMVINLEDDDDEPATQQLEPVIPDSQEKENRPVAEEKNDLEF